MTMQAGMTKVGELEFFTAIHRTLSQVFPVVAGYQAFVSCYGTPWGFIVGSRKVDPRGLTPAAVDRLIGERLGGPLGHWDGLTHQHCFALPKYIRTAIDAQTRVSTDANPLIVT
jgi:spermidine synthase